MSGSATDAAAPAPSTQLAHPSSAQAHNRGVWPALFIVYIAWGSTYLGIRVMDRSIPPFLGGGLRYMGAGLVMLAAIAAMRGRLPRIPLRELGSLALVGVLLLVGGNGGVALAERHVPSGLAALLVASVPLWVLVLRTISGDRPQRLTFAGLAVGFVGVGLLVVRGGHGQGAGVPWMLVVVAAALSWALGSWLAGRLPMPADAVAGTAYEMVIGGAGLFALGTATGERWSQLLLHASLDSLLAVAYLATFGSILAFTAYVWLLQNAPITQISTYAYVNPIVAVVLGAIILGEMVTGITLIGGAIIVVAVALVIRSEAPRRRRE